MNENILKIALLWLLIAISYSMHSIYHLSELFFGIDIKLPDANGKVPLNIHFFRIATEVFTLLMVVLTIKIKARAYNWFSFIWACLLGILNLVHFVSTFIREPSEISQIALLAFVLAVNVLLAIEIYKAIRIKNNY